MIDQLTLQTIGMLITGISMCIAVTYYSLNVRNANRARQSQIIGNFMSWWSIKENTEMWHDLMYNWEFNDFEDFNKKYGVHANPDANSSLTTVGIVFSQLGYQMRMKNIEPIYAYVGIRNMVIQFWEKFEPIIMEMREQLNFPRALWAVEYLYDEVKKLDAKQLNAV